MKIILLLLALSQPVVVPPLTSSTDFNALVTRMQAVELKATVLEQRTDSLDTRLTTLEQAVATLTTRVAALESPAIDCAGTWSNWQVINCTTCTNNSQVCNESRIFTITTNPSNGGVDCPSSPETRSVTQSCTTPSPPTGDNAYFSSLVARSDHYKSYSLRDPKQLQTVNNGGYAQCNSCPLNVTYDPTNDPDPRKLDLAKLVIPSNVVSLRNFLYLPFGTIDGETYLITWDAWFGAEFDFANTNIATYKTWQFAQSAGTSCLGQHQWFEIQSRFSQASGPAIANVTGRSYFTPTADPIPAVGSFIIQPEIRTRFWVLIERGTSGQSWVSLWVADSNRDAVQIINRFQKASCPNINNIWIEYNTSSAFTTRAIGPLVSYLGNFVILRGPNVLTIPFSRP